MLSRRSLQSSAKLWNPLIMNRQSSAIVAIAYGPLRAQLAARPYSSMRTKPTGDGGSEACWFRMDRQLWNNRDNHLDKKECWGTHNARLLQSVGRSTASLLCQENRPTRISPIVSVATGTVISPDGYIITSARGLGLQQSTEPLNKIKVWASLRKSDYMKEKGTVVFADYHYDVAIVKLNLDYKDFLQVPKFSSFTDSDQSITSSPFTYFGRYNPPGILHNSFEEFVYKKSDLVRMEDTPMDQGDITQELLKFENLSREDLEEYYPKDLAPSDQELSNPSMRNLGGPVVDDNGGVVGVLTTARSGHEYAVPSHLIFKIFRHYQTYGRVHRPYLGVTFSASDCSNWIDFMVNDSNLSPKTHIPNGAKAVRIHEVVPNSPAHRGGFQERDVVLKVNGEWIRNPYQLTDLFWGRIAGCTTEFTVVSATNPGTILTRKVWLESRLDCVDEYESEEKKQHDDELSHNTDDIQNSSSSDTDADNGDGEDNVTHGNGDGDGDGDGEDNATTHDSDSDSSKSSDSDSSMSSDSDSDSDSSMSLDVDVDDGAIRTTDVKLDVDESDKYNVDDGSSTITAADIKTNVDGSDKYNVDDAVDVDVDVDVDDDDDDVDDDVDDEADMMESDEEKSAKMIMKTLSSIQKQIQGIAKEVESQLGKKANTSTVDKLKWDVSRLKRGV